MFNKHKLFLSVFLLLQGCDSQVHRDKIENEKKIEKKINEYNLMRKKLIQQKTEDVFGVGLGTSYKDLEILMNPALTGINSALYEDDIAEFSIPEQIDKYELVSEKPLYEFTKSYLYKIKPQDLINELGLGRDDILVNYAIRAIKPSEPFQYYKVELSKKYGVCAIEGNYYSKTDSNLIGSKSTSRSIFNASNKKMIVDILNKKYQLVDYFEVPDESYLDENADGKVSGKWQNKKMNVELNGGFWWDDSKNQHEVLAIRYIAKDQRCHNDVKMEFEKQKSVQEAKNKKQQEIDQKNRFDNSSL